MRRQDGDSFRIFNGRDGEFLAHIIDLGKKSGAAHLMECIKEQPDNAQRRHLVFAPLKKHRMDLVIEKAIELGATDLHPVITRHTEVRSLKSDRIQKQMLEALEQCERLVIPTLHDICDLSQKLATWPAQTPLYACLERGVHPHLNTLDMSKECGFIIGPVGGFEEGEFALLEQSEKIIPISLGKSIYRAETASIICLAYADLFG